MDTAALRSYVEQTQRRVEEGTQSAGETRLRLVQPFLSTLGWTLDRTATDYEISVDSGVETVDFALLIDGSPEIVVETRACQTALTDQTMGKLGTLLRQSSVNWGLLTNGRSFVFVTVNPESGSLERCVLPLESLHKESTVVCQYTSEAAVERVRDRRRQYARAAARLDEKKSRVHEAIVDRVTAVTGSEVTDSVDAATEEFLDELLETFDTSRAKRGRYSGQRNREYGNQEGDREQGKKEGDRAKGNVSNDREQANEFDRHTDPTGTTTGMGSRSQDSVNNDQRQKDYSEDTAPERRVTSSDQESDRESADTQEFDSKTADRTVDALDGLDLSEIDPQLSNGLAAHESDREFVIRFFDGSASVGAVGHPNAATATRLAIEYLLEHRQLERSITLPWGVEDDTTFLTTDVLKTSSTVTLENGWQFDADRSIRSAQHAIERLAAEAGLRVMFQGQWAK